MAFLLSMVVVILHTKPVISSVVVGTKIEGFLILALLALWSAVAAIVSDTRHGLATDPSGAISNGNLYYFSWIGFGCGASLLVSYLRSVFGLDLPGELRSRSQRLQHWVLLGVLGLVQMGSSARLFDNHCGANGLGEEETGSVKFCRRCKLGIVLGVFSVISSMIISGAKLGISGNPRTNQLLYSAELMGSCLLAGGQALGVAWLTSDEGPGAPIGNLFYSSWAALVVAILLVSSCVENWSEAKGLRGGSGGNSGENAFAGRSVAGSGSSVSPSLRASNLTSSIHTAPSIT